MAFAFDGGRHPRGYHGRFSAGAGGSGNAHAMRMPSRPRPEAIKRIHAVTPVVRRGPTSAPAGG